MFGFIRFPCKCRVAFAYQLEAGSELCTFQVFAAQFLCVLVVSGPIKIIALFERRTFRTACKRISFSFVYTSGIIAAYDSAFLRLSDDTAGIIVSAYRCGIITIFNGNAGFVISDHAADFAAAADRTLIDTAFHASGSADFAQDSADLLCFTGYFSHIHAIFDDGIASGIACDPADIVF